MKALLLREIKSFFGSLTGYLVIAVFLILNGIFLWIVDGSYNILQSGYNDLTPFFQLAPLVLLLLIPAITMKSISDERKQGTIELLVTKPLSLNQIVTGKFFGAFLLVVIAILPTLLYIIILNPYGLPAGNMDMGSTIGSYLGLLFLMAAYTSIGIFCSSLSENQIVAFITAVVICFVLYMGFDQLAELFKSSATLIEKVGMSYHFKSMSRGVIDTRDVIYFVSLTIFFLMATVFNLKSVRK
ncbi:gliding motility-associated ABC transporter permease subunit GldF [Flavobacterium sp. CBA20B-1]|uniref:gliding motility-associated ABC transporter permease subunit GldF n=1 Tax=unclassified Flavobacterium TaxID=196869 RepID=UPI002224088B|nr:MULTISPECIES: gliding motility-associated ABC transporter permease subunit GldF [unclassified Flavobacterium]WCM43007.1 gliding motility-associated ABC transporter permease subunit GldF [Flavobacterium sp. CBA20B-1]